MLVTYLDEEVASFDLYHKELNYTISHVYLSIKDYTDKQPTNKRILINGREEINLAEGFENLHTVSYEQILAGNGHHPDSILDTMKIIDKLNRSAP